MLVNSLRVSLVLIYLPLVVVAGFVLLGAAFEKKLPVVAIIFGWGMAE